MGWTTRQFNYEINIPESIFKSNMERGRKYFTLKKNLSKNYASSLKNTILISFHFFIKTQDFSKRPHKFDHFISQPPRAIASVTTFQHYSVRWRESCNRKSAQFQKKFPGIVKLYSSISRKSQNANWSITKMTTHNTSSDHSNQRHSLIQ